LRARRLLISDRRPLFDTDIAIAERLLSLLIQDGTIVALAVAWNLENDERKNAGISGQRAPQTPDPPEKDPEAPTPYRATMTAMMMAIAGKDRADNRHFVTSITSPRCIACQADCRLPFLSMGS
jgi:hypothetical protein